MDLMLNKESGIPLYKQVKHAITGKIQAGELMTGFKMPTERELSELLHVSRNTVSAAYKELEKEGLLTSHQGKGTFVAEESERIATSGRHERVLRLIGMAMEEALDSGMEAKEFLHLVEEQVNAKVDLIRSANAVYIECNIEQARYFARQIEAGTNMKCVPLTIADLIEMTDETRLLLYRARVIVSTFNHVPEVMEYVQGFSKTVLGVAINPDLKTIVRIARLPRETRFTFVCISDEFMSKVRAALETSGLSDLDIIYVNTKDPQKLGAILGERDVAIVSPGRFRDVQPFVEQERIIPFLYNLDDGSLKTLKQSLLEHNIV